METTFVIGNFVGNAGLIAAAGFIIKKWIGDQESKVQKTANDLEEHTKDTSAKLAAFTKETTETLKESIKENREDFKERADTIIDRLEKLSDHVATANGRTTKNEIAISDLAGNVKTQIALCKARNDGRRLSDRCE